jgi:hypothetical protein
MTTDPNNFGVNDEPLPRDDADLLISRAVDGRTSQAEWVLLELAAAQDPSVWRRLAQAHWDQALLSKGVLRAADIADRVDLPTVLEAERAAHEHRPFFGNVRSWGGWAAAAILTFAVVVQTSRIALQGTPSTGLSEGPSQAAPNTAGVGSGLASAADAFNAYLTRGKQEGRVLGEVPDQVLVDSRPSPDGEGFDVLYVRQVVEKARVKDLYRFSHDEAGRVTPVRVEARPTTKLY